MSFAIVNLKRNGKDGWYKDIQQAERMLKWWSIVFEGEPLVIIESTKFNKASLRQTEKLYRIALRLKLFRDDEICMRLDEFDERH